MFDQLLYRRQFLLARQPIQELESWNKLSVGQYFLHTHPDLETTVVCDSTKTLTLLGYLFAPEEYQSSNREILCGLSAKTKDFDSFTLALKQYAGRYAVF